MEKMCLKVRFLVVFLTLGKACLKACFFVFVLDPLENCVLKCVFLCVLFGPFLEMSVFVCVLFCETKLSTRKMRLCAWGLG